LTLRHIVSNSPSFNPLAWPRAYRSSRIREALSGIFVVGGDTTPIGSTIGKVPCLFAPSKTFNVYTTPMPTYSGSDEFTFTFTRLDNPCLQSMVTAVPQACGAASGIQ